MCGHTVKNKCIMHTILVSQCVMWFPIMRMWKRGRCQFWLDGVSKNCWIRYGNPSRHGRHCVLWVFMPAVIKGQVSILSNTRKLVLLSSKACTHRQTDIASWCIPLSGIHQGGGKESFWPPILELGYIDICLGEAKSLHLKRAWGH